MYNMLFETESTLKARYFVQRVLNVYSILNGYLIHFNLFRVLPSSKPETWSKVKFIAANWKFLHRHNEKKQIYSNLIHIILESSMIVVDSGLWCQIGTTEYFGMGYNKWVSLKSLGWTCLCSRNSYNIWIHVY